MGFSPIAVVGSPKTAPAFPPGWIPGILSQQNVYIVVFLANAEFGTYCTLRHIQPIIQYNFANAFNNIIPTKELSSIIALFHYLLFPRAN